jgi:hypothetical protein
MEIVQCSPPPRSRPQSMQLGEAFDGFLLLYRVDCRVMGVGYLQRWTTSACALPSISGHKLEGLTSSLHAYLLDCRFSNRTTLAVSTSITIT